MDISIDTLIYIFIGVIFVLAQVLRMRNKKKGGAAAPAQPVGGESDRPLKDFWEEFLGEEKSPEAARPAHRTETVPPVDDIDLSFHRFDPGIDEKIQPESSFTGMDYSADDGGMDAAGPPDSLSGNESFDLRSAVIYSVILERKYV